MIVLEKERIDDDRWNIMCRRVKRVEFFNLLVVLLNLLVSLLVMSFYMNVTITWNNPNYRIKSAVSHQAPKFEAEDFMEISIPSNPSIRKRHGVDIEKISPNENKGNEMESRNQFFDDVFSPQEVETSHERKETKEDLEKVKMFTNNEIGKFVAEKQRSIKDHATTYPKDIESPIRISPHNIDEDKAMVKNETLNKAPRDLQSDDEMSSCEGTLFQLEINLDFFADETAWELGETTSDDVIAFFNYTSDMSRTTQTYTTCLNDGQYFFILYDRFADGITCGKKSCFSISLNGEVALSNVPFTSGELMFPFDTSNECPLGTLFELEYSSALAPDSSWTLSRVMHRKKNEPIEMKQEIIVGNNISRSSTCVPQGTYLLEGQNVDCDDCYKVFINNQLMRQGKDFLGTDRHKFYVSDLGNGYEQHCEKLPQLTSTSFVKGFVYDEETDRKLDAIYSLASMDTITSDLNSPQYKAACWIVFDDKVAYANGEDSSNSTTIIDDEFMERYVLALFLFATKKEIEKLHVKNCEYDEFKVFCKDERIIKMDFWNADVRGFIPSEIHHLRKLETLILASNQFLRGTIPSQLSRLNHLKDLDLSENSLSGSIPAELGNLASLKHFALSDNALTGNIPGSLGRCSMLTEIFLDRNLLEGSIPPGLFRSENIEILSLARNNLTGTIPSNIGQLKNLHEIVLEENSLEGSIPKELWTLSSLRLIDFDRNRLIGSIQSEIGNLRHLEWFDADQNKLTGKLPNVFTNLTNLQTMDISSNRFEGQIPDTLWQSNVDNFFITLNDVVGTVPADFCSVGKQIKVDESNWFAISPKVDCSCCSEGQCYVWDFNLDIEHIQCPSDNIITFDYFVQYQVTDTVANETVEHIIGPKGSSANLCLSPTGCYDVNFQMAMVESGKADKNVVFSLGRKVGGEGLAVVKNNETDVCIAVNVCGEMIGEHHKKRAGLNHLTQLAAPDLSKLGDKDSATYKALCDVITKDEMYDEYQICDGTLLQRYVLLYFYYSQKLNFDFLDLATNHTCMWPGVSCDSSNTFIKRLDLSNTNLSGSIITQIGLLRTLEEIDLSNNTFVGTIDPALYIDLPDLKIVRLGTNKFAGTFPRELLEYGKIRDFNISRNLFVGSLPEDILYSKDLNRFDISNNLFQGKFPITLLDCPNLEAIALAKNNFKDKIPTGIGHLKKLNFLALSENSFSGSIPFEIFEATEIKELMLQSNKLTGSIPTEIAKLKNAEGLFMSHNKLKGFIPKELGELDKLQKLQLHLNRLHGEAPLLMRSKKGMDDSDYVTDCGAPFWDLEGQLICDGCTMCCNSEEVCQLADPTVISNLQLILVVVLVPLACTLLFILSVKKRANWFFDIFVDDRDPLSIYNDDSVYCFILSNNHWATALYAATVIVQLAIFSTYLRNSEFRIDADWEYGYHCLANNLYCVKDRTDTYMGVILFFVVTILFLGNDISMSLLQMRKSVYLYDRQLFLSGFILFFLTAYSLLVSFRYNTALAEKNTSWITNAMILLFVNEVDEKVLSVLIALAPDWTEQVLEEVSQNMLTKVPRHMPAYTPNKGSARRNITNTKESTSDASPYPNAISGIVRATSRRLSLLLKKPEDKSKTPHERELDYPFPIQSGIVEEEYPSPNTNEFNDQEISQSETDYLDSNKDPTDAIVSNLRHITEFDFDGPSPEEEVNGDDPLDSLNGDTPVFLEVVEPNVNETGDLDTVKCRNPEPVILEVIQSHENTPGILGASQGYNAEPSVNEVVQSHDNLAGPQDSTQGNTSESVVLEDVQSPIHNSDDWWVDHGRLDEGDSLNQK